MYPYSLWIWCGRRGFLTPRLAVIEEEKDWLAYCAAARGPNILPMHPGNRKNSSLSPLIRCERPRSQGPTVGRCVNLLAVSRRVNLVDSKMKYALESTMAHNRPPRWRWAPVFGWMAVIFHLSSRSDSGNQSAWLTTTIFGVLQWPQTAQAMKWWEHVFRKTAHFTEYAVLAMMLVWALGAKSKRGLAVAWGLATLYAASDEFHQIFVPNRGPSVWDVALDSTGAAAAVGLLWVGWLLWRL
jgi:VanZ family protein